MFIALEGIDGSGKTTVAEMLSEKLEQEGTTVFLTHEPTDNFVPPDSLASERDAGSALILFFRFTEDRFRHQDEIRKHLEGGETVITDRYLLSSIAYQGPLLENLFGSDTETVRWMMQVSEIITQRPDINVLLNVKPDVAIRRLVDRRSRTGFEELEYMTRVAGYYSGVLRKHLHIVDAERSTGEVTAAILELVMQS